MSALDAAVAVARELELTLWLLERGLPVLPVADELPPRVYVHDGQQMTFWRHVGEQRERDGAAAGRALHSIDEALRDYDGELDGFWPVDETRTVLHALEPLTISWGTFVYGWTERIEQRLEWLRANVP